MSEIYNYFFSGSFSDPFIKPSEPFVPASTPSLNPLVPPSLDPESKPPSPSSSEPQISRDLFELENKPIIVYRNSTPTALCKGPDILIPVLNLEITNSQNDADFSVNCISTYPKNSPFSPIADRYEVRFFRDSFILTLTDGCGLHPSSRLAPKAAIEGFWKYLAPRIKEDQERFDIHKLGLYLQSAIRAAHFNIYWDAYKRSQEGFTDLIESITQTLQKLDEDADSKLIPAILNQKKAALLEEVDLIQKALAGDIEVQKILVEKNIHQKFYENYAGATTFMCSALIKSASGDHPYYLLTLNLGDGQAFLFRDGQLKELTKDPRRDLSNVRDPGGKIGLCSPVPLKMDKRNMQFSLTPCQSNDLLFFMTDGVIDNLNPQRLGFSPNGGTTPFWIQDKYMEATGLNPDEYQEILKLLNLEATSWDDLSLEKGNALKAAFAHKTLELMIKSSSSSEEANEKIIQYCMIITEGHREKENSPFTTTPQDKLGKPDHTTCLSYQVP